MADEHCGDADGELFRRILEGVGEGHLADRDTLTIMEAYRLQQKLALSTVEQREPYILEYSTRDIERLQDLSRDDYARIRKDWHQWHFASALAWWQFGLWLGAAALSWMLFFHAEWVRSYGPLASLPTLALKAVGVFVGLGAVLTAPLAISGLASEENWNGYIAGYEEGLRQGVNRALAITPAHEKAMWEDLKEADLASVSLNDKSEKQA